MGALVLGSIKSCSDHLLDLFLGILRFESLAMLVYSQLLVVSCQ